MPSSPRPIELIGAPFDLGASQRGCRLAPDALRALDLIGSLRELGREIQDGGNIRLPIGPSSSGEPPNPKLKNLDQVIAACEALAERVENALQSGRVPLVIGGDHTVAMGAVGGVARVTPNMGLIWVDAHADYNDSTSTPSGNIHGMPLAAITGRADAALNAIAEVNPKVDPKHVVLVGIRDLDPLERPRVRESGMTVITSWEIERDGIEAVAAEALRIAGDGTDGIHLSFDIDAIGPQEMPGTGTRSPGGLSFREASVLVHRLHESGQLVCLEFNELNPLLDIVGQSCRLTKELVLIALGKMLS